MDENENQNDLNLEQLIDAGLGKVNPIQSKEQQGKIQDYTGNDTQAELEKLVDEKETEIEKEQEKAEDLMDYLLSKKRIQK